MKLLLLALLAWFNAVAIDRPVLAGSETITGRATPGATVRLTIVQDPLGSVDITTGSDGVFVFGNVRLEPGYVICAISQGNVDCAVVEMATYKVFLPVGGR